MSNIPFAIRGFNLCESLLRHSPDQLRNFLRRMKTLQMNTVIVHYDYGWNRYKGIIMEECRKNGIKPVLMTFGPRTFFSYVDWKNQWFAKAPDGSPWTPELVCETQPCTFEPEGLDAFRYGARQWLKSLPEEIKHVHMRSGDGIKFCQCEKCRLLPDHEKWQPFIDIFVEAIREVRPGLEFETDLYVKRYNIPEKKAAFQAMTNVMFDDFNRHYAYPLDSVCDLDFPQGVCIAATEKNPDASTTNAYLLKRLSEWAGAFPGKVYVHENVMAQGLFTTFVHNPSVYLRDLEIYRKLGVQGVCYEAYEPGYTNFSSMFSLLARALNGESVEYEPDEMERIMTAPHPKTYFFHDPDFPLEKYIKDPIRLKQTEMYRYIEMIRKTGGKASYCYSAEFYREFMNFYFEHGDRFDSLMAGYQLAYTGRKLKHLDFKGLSDDANEFLSYSKLWDYMETIPLTEDPRQKCRNIILELMDKAFTIKTKEV